MIKHNIEISLSYMTVHKSETYYQAIIENKGSNANVPKSENYNDPQEKNKGSYTSGAQIRKVELGKNWNSCFKCECAQIRKKYHTL